MKKNEVCCEKGLPYKYCCVKNELRNREMTVILDEKRKIAAKIDMTNDLLNMDSSAQLPLKYFCKDNEFYFFGLLTVGTCSQLYDKLIAKSLQKKDFIDAYKEMLKEEPTTKLFQSAIDEMPSFKKRETQILKVIKAHYNGDFELSIPVLFTLLEGILREIGGLKNHDTFKPTIPLKIWENSGMYFAEDDARNYNHFIHQLFEGGRDEETFNRNPILHGFNVNYHSEEHSLLLMLALLEIRNFNFWTQHIHSFPQQVKNSLLTMLKDINIGIGGKFTFKAGFSEYSAEIISL